MRNALISLATVALMAAMVPSASAQGVGRGPVASACTTDMTVPT